MTQQIREDVSVHNSKHNPLAVFQEMVWAFTIASFLGVILETVFCFIFTGQLTSRTGMIFGPFNQVYGLAAILITGLLYYLEKKTIRYKKTVVFACCFFVGGAFEFVCSLFQETVFLSKSWDYQWMSISLLGGRTNLFYMALFGGLGVVYATTLYPAIHSRCHHWPQKRSGAVAACIIAVFMVANMAFSARVVLRWSERQYRQDNPPTQMEQYIDTVYPDDTLRLIYPSLEFSPLR